MSGTFRKMQDKMHRMTSSLSTEAGSLTSPKREEYDKLVGKMGTGDLLLFRTSGDFSMALVQKSLTPYYHVAIVLLRPPIWVLDLYGITKLRDPNDLYAFESVEETEDGRQGGGVQLRPLGSWMMQHQKRAHGNDPFGILWRQLLHVGDADRKGVGDFPDLPKLLSQAHGLPFEKPSSYLSTRVMHKAEDLSSLFSSELVAWCYREMKLFPADENSSVWAPHHFSQTYKDDHVNTSLHGGARLAAERSLGHSGLPI
eukprot:GGOE01000823.1.p1 GENE.GGOE01000823.1~~GGOE01000823.1.p1  ORF type:complete len:287 (-),score=68.56 GGOE01000823.1:622-1389(-)